MEEKKTHILIVGAEPSAGRLVHLLREHVAMRADKGLNAEMVIITDRREIIDVPDITITLCEVFNSRAASGLVQSPLSMMLQTVEMMGKEIADCELTVAAKEKQQYAPAKNRFEKKHKSCKAHNSWARNFKYRRG